MTPLKVSIAISTPMVMPTDLFHLDALLGALRVGQAEAEHGNIEPRDWHHDLPVDRHKCENGEWVFKASAFRLTQESDLQLWMTTGRTNLNDLADYREAGLTQSADKVPTNGSHFKSTIARTPIIWARLEAFCIGDKAAIQRLLDGCSSVGGKRGTGFGRVQSITVSDVEAKDCHWEYRALPAGYHVGNSEEYALALSALNAPYWDKTAHKPALIPLSDMSTAPI